MPQRSSSSDAYSAAFTSSAAAPIGSSGPDTSAASAPLLDPRNDYVFKRIFASHLSLLNDLVNVVRGDAAPLTLTEVLNPNILPEDITGKEIILDILAADKQGKNVDVEVQVNYQSHYPTLAQFGDTLIFKVSPN
ncbi:MAG: PD-(D/E)XK nuclease family transposase [Burkholderiaceae bacterium]